MAGYTLQLLPITVTLYTIQDKQTLKYLGLKAEYPPISPYTQISVYSSLLNSYHAESLYFICFLNIQAGF
jgi:hypothetical protein